MPTAGPVSSPDNNGPGFCSQQRRDGSCTTSRLTNEPCSSFVRRCRLPEPHGASHSSSHHDDPTTSPDAATESQPVPTYPNQQQSQSLYSSSRNPATDSHTSTEPVLSQLSTTDIPTDRTHIHKGRYKLITDCV